MPSSSNTPPQPSLQRQLTAKLTSPDEAEKLQRQVTSHPPQIGAAGEHVMELEWEEWDGSGSFKDHCLCGSLAGVVEHGSTYPLDTWKTRLQAYCADCPQNVKNIENGSSNATKTTVQRLTTAGTTAESVSTKTLLKESAANFTRLFRGVETMMLGVIPAHALYFSSYEAVKALFLSADEQNLGPLGSAVAGASAAFCHDLCMTPCDTVKQRQQLGHYNGLRDAFSNIIQKEGPSALYKSFPVTLLTNLPYGMIMVTTNEYLREVLEQRSGNQVLDVKTTMMAGMGAGAVAAAITTPLDRVKTRLQTQGLANIAMPTITSCDGVPESCPKVAASEEAMSSVKPKYQGLSDAFKSIMREEGWLGFFRGMTPRLMTHTPAIAISWTTYEAAKMYLLSS